MPPQSLEDVESTATRRQIQNHEVECVRMSSEKPIVPGRRDYHVVMLGLKGRSQLGRAFVVFDNEGTDVNEMVSTYTRPVPSFCVRKGHIPGIGAEIRDWH